MRGSASDSILRVHEQAHRATPRVRVNRTMCATRFIAATTCRRAARRARVSRSFCATRFIARPHTCESIVRCARRGSSRGPTRASQSFDLRDDVHRAATTCRRAARRARVSRSFCAGHIHRVPPSRASQSFDLRDDVHRAATTCRCATRRARVGRSICATRFIARRHCTRVDRSFCATKLIEIVRACRLSSGLREHLIARARPATRCRCRSSIIPSRRTSTDCV